MLSTAKNLFTGIVIGSVLMNQRRMDDFAYTIRFPATKDRIRGEYENGIRRNAPPEKIFEIFATIKKDNKIFMSHSDLFRALTPYNYAVKDDNEEESGDKKDNEEKKEQWKSKIIFDFADVDHDGTINIYEYYIFVLFLQSSNKFAKEYFEKKCPNSEIDKETFRKYLREIRKGNKHQLTMLKYLPDPRLKSDIRPDKFEKIESGIIDHIFKNDPKITIDKLVHLREEMYSELYQYEYQNFPRDSKNRISGEDFAKSIICYLEPSVAPKYLRRLQDVEFPGTVTFDEYATFQRFFREHYSEILKECEEKGVLTRKYLRKMLDKFSRTQHVKITDNQLEIFIKVLDVDQNNRIDYNEFAGVVVNQTFYGGGDTTPNLEKPLALIEKKINVWSDKAERIWKIMME